MFKKLNIIFIIVSSACVFGLLVSAFAFDSYVQKNPEIRQELKRTNGDPHAITAICEKIHLPLTAQSMNFFVPASFLSTLMIALIWALSLRKNLPGAVRRLSLVLILVGVISLLAVQIWEPDFAYVLCGLV